jgi:hypothetical protein
MILPMSNHGGEKLEFEQNMLTVPALPSHLDIPIFYDPPTVVCEGGC